MDNPLSLEKLAGALTEAQRRVILDERTAKPWEPKDPSHRIIRSFIDMGLLERRDGRCGFERLRDAFVAWTPLGLRVRQHLQNGGGE